MRQHAEAQGRALVPRSLELTLLATMLDEPPYLASAAASGIQAEMLNYRDCQVMLGAALDLFQGRGSVTYGSLTSEIFERGLEEQAMPGLEELATVGVDKIGFGDYLGRVIGSWNVRGFYELLRQAEDQVFAPGLSLLQRENKISDVLGKLLQGLPDGENEFFDGDEFARVAERALEDALSGKRQAKQKTGVISLDAKTGGLVSGRVTVFAARTSHGKTAFMVYLAKQQVRLWRRLKERKQVLYFSAEMSEQEMAARVLSAFSGVAADRISEGRLSEKELKAARIAAEELRGLKISVDCNPAPTTAHMMGRAMAANASIPVGLIIFDYLEYTGEQDRSMDLRLDKALKGCHRIAKRIGCPVVVLSQISRELDRRGQGSKPRLSDLRYCGSIEQIASLVVMLYHEATHEKQLGNDRKISSGLLGTDPGKYELLIEKNTHGRLGDIFMRFDADSGAFEDPESRRHVQEPVF